MSRGTRFKGSRSWVTGLHSPICLGISDMALRDRSRTRRFWKLEMKCGIFSSPVRWMCHSWTWLSWTRQSGKTWNEGGVSCQWPKEATSCQLVLTFQSSCWICRTRRPSSVCSFCLSRARTARSSQTPTLSLDQDQEQDEDRDQNQNQNQDHMRTGTRTRTGTRIRTKPGPGKGPRKGPGTG